MNLLEVSSPPSASHFPLLIPIPSRPVLLRAWCSEQAGQPRARPTARAAAAAVSVRLRESPARARALARPRPAVRAHAAPPAVPPCRCRFACLGTLVVSGLQMIRQRIHRDLSLYKRRRSMQIDGISGDCQTPQTPQMNALNFFRWASGASPATIPNESLKNTESWFSWCTVNERIAAISAGKGGPGNAPT
jgi:hypothetical protein